MAVTANVRRTLIGVCLCIFLFSLFVIDRASPRGIVRS
ncbi:hypothetical protein BRPE64_ACDS24560 [Caballeronia insecticola]|uniref:Uncharacterized protein n=1 Tax=Caballeronia insecticola TaxID=758793 RepID=R4WTB5_9BURK|nr:hypothetical protein BRPE64_ACDS24560 [Caballeronia insecticola]